MIECLTYVGGVKHAKNTCNGSGGSARTLGCHKRLF